jgi:hypothetical protein
MQMLWHAGGFSGGGRFSSAASSSTGFHWSGGGPRLRPPSRLHKRGPSRGGAGIYGSGWGEHSGRGTCPSSHSVPETALFSNCRLAYVERCQ